MLGMGHSVFARCSHYSMCIGFFFGLLWKIAFETSKRSTCNLLEVVPEIQGKRNLHIHQG